MLGSRTLSAPLRRRVWAMEISLRLQTLNSFYMDPLRHQVPYHGGRGRFPAYTVL